MTSDRPNIVFYNHRPTYQAKIQAIVDLAKQSTGPNITQFENPVIYDRTPQAVGVKGIDNSDEFFKYIKTHKVDAIIHRNEHGVMWCNQQWKDITNYCLDHGIASMSFDFGYFDHYKQYMVDYYKHDCVSSIYHEWDSTVTRPDTVHWGSAPKSIQTYRDRFLEQLDKAKNRGPLACLRNKKYVVIWAQWTTDLIRLPFFQDDRPIAMSDWLQRLANMARDYGYEPVIKASPVESTSAFRDIDDTLCFVGRKKHLEKLPQCKFVPHVNAKLIAHADFHIICCSSVSNELVMAGAKVTAMGRSWFDNLGIFYEPQTWDTVFEYKQPDQTKVNWWVNWWLSRQCLKNDVVSKISEVYDKAQRKT